MNKERRAKLQLGELGQDRAQKPGMRTPKQDEMLPTAAEISMEVQNTMEGRFCCWNLVNS